MDEADRVAHQALIERYLKRFHNAIEDHSSKLVGILQDQCYPGEGQPGKRDKGRKDVSGLAVLSSYGMAHKSMNYWMDPVEVTWGPSLVDTMSYEDLITSATIPLESNPDVQKVLLVLCSITSQMKELREEGSQKFVSQLILYGDGFEDRRGANTSVTEGKGHVAISKFLPALYGLDELRENCILLITNCVQQLGALFKDSKPHVVSISGLHLPSVFRELANLLALLVVLDEVIGNQPILQEQWTKYRRMIKSVRADSATFSVDPSQLVKLEKDLTQLDRHIMSGHIFRSVVEHVTAQAGRSKSNTLFEKISYCLTAWSNTVEKDFMDGMDELKPIAISALFIFTATLFPNSFDGKKLFQKVIWDNLKKIHAVPIAGAILWVPETFFNVFPVTNKLFDSKTLQSLVNARHTFLQMKVGSLANDVLSYNIQIGTWSLRLQEAFYSRDLSHAKREDLIRRSNLLSQGVRLAEMLSQNFRLIINLHATLGRPMTKQTVSLLCQVLELVKITLCIFHRYNVQVCESAAAVVQNVLHIALANVGSLRNHFMNLRDPKRVDETRADTLAVLAVLENVLKASPSKKRLLVAKVAFEWVTASYRLWREEDNTGVLAAALDRINLMVELQDKIRESCDGSPIYWHRVILSAYFSRIYTNETEATKLPIMFLVLNDCLEMIKKKSPHGEDAQQNFVAEVEDCFSINLVEKLCRDLETDLRLMTHTHLHPNGDSTPELKDFKQLLEAAPILFNGGLVNLRFTVELYLAKTYYNLASVALHDWQSYATMRVLASDKYDLCILEDHLPGHSLEQGLDILEIVRNLGKFVTEFSYSLNNQIFVQVNSPNKHLDTVNIRHLANSMRTHGPGLTNTTVNSTYQFLRSKIYILSQFLYDEQIKSRLSKEIRLFKQGRQAGSNNDENVLPSAFKMLSPSQSLQNHSTELHSFPYERVLKFQSGIRKLGLSPDGLSPLDQFRLLITHIGNALGFVRLVSSGQLHFLADGSRFIPDLNDIPEFNIMVREINENGVVKAELCDQIHAASSNVDSALKCLSSAVTDGVNYLRLLANGFAGPLRESRNAHLKNFYVVVPALTLSYVDHMRSCKEKLLKKSNSPPIFTDDGFPMGVAFLLAVLGQDQEFDSLHWFAGVTKKLSEDRSRALQAIQESKKDEKLQHANTLTAARLQDSLNEFNLLCYNLSSARIFFRQQQLSQKTSASA